MNIHSYIEEMPGSSQKDRLAIIAYDAYTLLCPSNGWERPQEDDRTREFDKLALAN